MARRLTTIKQALFLSLLPLLSTSAALAEDKGHVVHMGSFSKTVDYAPYLVARQKHWFEQALRPWHVDVEFTTFQTLPSINEAFASKKVDVVFEAETPAIVGKAAGIDLDIKELSAILNLQILVHKDAGVATISDLRGKKIAVLTGTSAHYGLLKNLEKAGLSKTDVSIIPMSPPDAHAAFDSKKIDAWAVWPPFVQEEIIAGNATTIPDTDAKIVVVMVMRKGFEKDHPDWTQAMVKMLNSSKNWVVRHPLEAQQITAAELNVPFKVVQMAWPSHKFDVHLTPEITADIQKKADFLKSVGFVKKAVDANALVTNSVKAQGQ